jgi:sulfopyruvate decarboxylase subunit alpha
MTISEKIVADFVANDVEFITTVPCKQLAGVIDAVEANKDIYHIPSNKEDEGNGFVCRCIHGWKTPSNNNAKHCNWCDSKYSGHAYSIL